MNQLTTLAAMPSGGGSKSTLPAEVGKKPAPKLVGTPLVACYVPPPGSFFGTVRAVIGAGGAGGSLVGYKPPTPPDPKAALARHGYRVDEKGFIVRMETPENAVDQQIRNAARTAHTYADRFPYDERN